MHSAHYLVHREHIEVVHTACWSNETYLFEAYCFNFNKISPISWNHHTLSTNTKPADADSDQNNIPDEDEIRLGIDSNDSDSDGGYWVLAGKHCIIS